MLYSSDHQRQQQAASAEINWTSTTVTIINALSPHRKNKQGDVAQTHRVMQYRAKTAVGQFTKGVKKRLRNAILSVSSYTNKMKVILCLNVPERIVVIRTSMAAFYKQIKVRVDCTCDRPCRRLGMNGARKDSYWDSFVPSSIY